MEQPLAPEEYFPQTAENLASGGYRLPHSYEICGNELCSTSALPAHFLAMTGAPLAIANWSKQFENEDRMHVNDALRKRRVGGGRALYDAVGHALDHAARGRLDYRALIVISTGDDTASRLTLAELVDRLAGSPTAVYAIGLVAPDRVDKQPDVLKRLTALSGGDAFFARTASELTSILERIARDIRASYTMGYVAPEQEDTEGFREVTVTLAHADRAARLRYRTGYTGGLR